MCTLGSREPDQGDQGADSAGEDRGLGRMKSILAASTREHWEADGSRLWVHKGDTELRVVDLTDDEGRVELKRRVGQKCRSGLGCP